MTTPKFERDIPIPEVLSRLKGCNKSHWVHKMDIGDSVGGLTQREVNSAGAIAHAFKGRRFVYRKLEDGTYRVWMTHRM